ncbi:MAG: hypothetical protein SFX18_01675 [Pirellulales bacterium]|nr:hypothetical protein [Pirellulales bacterium]
MQRRLLGQIQSEWQERLIVGKRSRGTRRRRQREANLLNWGRYYLPEHFRRTPSHLHTWLAEWLDQPRNNGWRLNVLAPRGAAKSTLVTLAYVLRTALTGQVPFIWIVSDTRAQAAGHLANLRAELTCNTRLARAYPVTCGAGPVWRAMQLQLRNGVTLEAIGTGQRVRGKRHRAARPGLILCDDLQNDGHALSPRLRELSRRWFFGMLLKAGTKRTNIVNLATALHRDALALELTRTAGWQSRTFAAIEKWPTRMDLWAAWERIYCNRDLPDPAADALRYYEEHQAEMEAGVELLWPAEEDLYTLMRQRCEGGRVAFDREKQNIPANPDSCEWPAEYFGDHLWFDEWPRDARVRAIAIDPSKGRTDRVGDYSAIVRLAIDPRGVVYVAADLSRRTTEILVADGIAWYRQFQPQVLGIEANQFQELLAAQLIAELTRQGLPAIPVIPVENTLAKVVRIRRWGPLLAQQRARFLANCPGTKLLVEQLRDFPHGAHDDGPDAAELALRLACEWLTEPAADGLGGNLLRG